VSELLHVPLDEIDPPAESIRQHIPEELIDELATSITAVGLIEPLVCERVAGRLRIIAGHRRFLACKRAGVRDVAVVVRDTSETSVEAVQIQENIIRQDMSPAEEARLFDRLYRHYGEDLEKVAGHVKLSVAYVDGRLALLQGDPAVLDALDQDQISLGVAQELNLIQREEWRRERLDVAIRGGATVALARRWRLEYNNLAALQSGAAPAAQEAPAAAPYVPVAASVACWFCEGSEDLHLLRMVQMHDNCVRALEALLKKIGRE
jgi:ParB/RepB/Spo0J family partition protein